MKEKKIVPNTEATKVFPEWFNEVYIVSEEFEKVRNESTIELSEGIPSKKNIEFRKRYAILRIVQVFIEHNKNQLPDILPLDPLPWHLGQRKSDVEKGSVSFGDLNVQSFSKAENYFIYFLPHTNELYVIRPWFIREESGFTLAHFNPDSSLFLGVEEIRRQNDVRATIAPIEMLPDSIDDIDENQSFEKWDQTILERQVDTLIEGIKTRTHQMEMADQVRRLEEGILKISQRSKELYVSREAVYIQKVNVALKKLENCIRRNTKEVPNYEEIAGPDWSRSAEVRYISLIGYLPKTYKKFRNIKLFGNENPLSS